MKKYIYIIVCAAFAATLHSCSSEVEGVDDTATAITTDDITVAPFPAFGDVQTRSTDAGAGHDKSSWEDGDIIYIQLNGKDSWYAMKYNGSEWTFPTDFPGIYREDTYKAVYAPNYEPNGSSLVLKDGAQPATAEYLTCEGKKPINISFERKYARIRIYTGGLNGSYTAGFDHGGSFKCNDDYTFSGSDIYYYTFHPDDNGNAYLYGTWNGYSSGFMTFSMDFFSSTEYLYLGPKSSDLLFATSSSINRSYVIDLSYATLDLDKVSAWGAAYLSTFADNGITNVKVKGSWKSVGFSSKFENIDLSEVTGLTELSDYAFNERTNLISIKLPSSLETIGESAFMSCNNLKSIELPTELTKIGLCAFQSCTSLESVVIQSKVTKLSSGSFYNCNKLSKVVCYATTPPEIDMDTFMNNADGIVLYVPANAISAYEKASYWSSSFNGNIKSISEMPEDE